MSITIAPEKTLVDAAKVAYAIAYAGQVSEDIVLRAVEFVDVHASVRAAVAAVASIGSHYRVVDIDAEYGIRGSHIDSAATLDDLGGAVAAVVSIKSKFDIDVPTQISIIGGLRREVFDLADTTETFVSMVIFIIEAPQKEQEPTHV